MRLGPARIPTLFESVYNSRRLLASHRLFSFRISTIILGLAFVLALFFGSEMRLPLVVAETMLLVLLYSVWAEDNLRCVTVERLLPECGYQDRILRVKLRVTNRGRATVGKMLVGDVFPADTDCEKERLDFRVLAPGESRVVEYVASCDGCFGTYTLTSPTLVTSDALGLFRRKISHPAPQRFTLFPKLVRFPSFEPLGASRYSSKGMEFLAKGDLNIAIAGVRDYVPGDALRTLHWPLSAKHGRLIVKEFERPAVPTVHVLCDVNAESVSHGLRTSGHERLLVAGVSLVRASCEVGLVSHFAMYTHSMHLRRVEPGIESFPAFLRWICDEREIGSGEFTGLVAEYAPLLRRGDVVFVLMSDWMNPMERRLFEFTSLVEFGVEVVALVVSENEAAPRASGVDTTLGESFGIPICFYKDPQEIPALVELCSRRGV